MAYRRCPNCSELWDGMSDAARAWAGHLRGDCLPGAPAVGQVRMWNGSSLLVFRVVQAAPGVALPWQIEYEGSELVTAAYWRELRDATHVVTEADAERLRSVIVDAALHWEARPDGTRLTEVRRAAAALRQVLAALPEPDGADDGTTGEAVAAVETPRRTS